jgi:uncharacterized DUF497 family protein
MNGTVSISECQGFEWDEANVEKNWCAHRVSPNEAEQVFFNKPLLTGDDTKHSQKEKRYYVLGQTDQGRLLFIAFTVRQPNIRVISARDMSRKEGKMYREQ